MKPSDIIALPQMKSTASKLVEIAARNYLKLRFNYNKIIMPETLCIFLNKAIYCPCSEPIWVRRFMFLAEYDVRKYSKSPIAPRGTDFILPQLEFCCSIRNEFSTFILALRVYAMNSMGISIKMP